MPTNTTSPQSNTIPDCLKDDMPVLTASQDAVVFKLGAEWCSACKRLDVYLDSADGHRETAAFALQRVDWDRDRSLYQCFADNQYVDLSTMTIPAFLVFDRGTRFLGYVVYDHTKPLTDQIMSRLQASRSQEADQTRHP